MITSIAIKELISISNELDGKGLYKEADIIDRLIYKSAFTTPGVDSMMAALGPDLVAAIKQNHGSVEAFEQKTLLDGVIKWTDKALQGLEALGGFVSLVGKVTKIPGLALLGRFIAKGIDLTAAFKGLTGSVMAVWGEISKALDNAKASIAAGKQFCLRLADFEQTGKGILMLVKLIKIPGFSQAIGLTKLVAEKAAMLGLDLKEQGEAAVAKLLSKEICFGKGSDVISEKPAEATSPEEDYEAVAAEVEPEIVNSLKMIGMIDMKRQREMKRRSVPGNVDLVPDPTGLRDVEMTA